MQAVLDTICPGEGDLIYKSVLEESGSNEECVNIDLLAEVYKNAETWQTQRQILSIISEQASFETSKQLLPELTRWKYYQSIKHGDSVGVGMPVQTVNKNREKINDGVLEHFLDFITSAHIIKDIPFGQRKLKLTSGEILEVPNVVRCLSASSLIAQYQQVCEEENVESLGKSTMYKILTECAASVRQSVEGLDNFIMEGARAFQILEELLESCGLKEMSGRLVEGKRYLKTDFKVHLATAADVMDHCITYALSSEEACFRTECDHSHRIRCQGCLSLRNTLDDIIKWADESEWENKDSVLFKVEKAVADIVSLQKHHVRSKNQELSRNQIVSNMTENDVFITCDWAMKFLPRKFREGQLDWFGKRGINWHISVSLTKLDTKFHTQTHIHIFNEQTAQDAHVTAAVISDVVSDLRRTVPNMQNVHLLADNAGCYKSSSTILSLKESTQEINTFNFSESQNGKGPCDRKASHAKAAIKRYINEGRDVTSAEDMKKALDRMPKRSFKVKVVHTVHNVDQDKCNSSIIPQISTFFNFKYEKEGLRVWQAFKIVIMQTLIFMLWQFGAVASKFSC